MTTSFRFGNVEMRRYLDFRMMYPEEYKEAMRKASQEGLSLLAHATPYESVALFLTPKMGGFSALNVEDLTEVEFTCRDVARKGLEFYRRHVPGFERAWILDTASQIGTRHARRLVGVERITIEHWRSSGLYPDSIGLCPGVTEKFPTLQIPYRCMVPRDVEGVLAAGRNLSADTKSHAALREIPECWVMGEAAGQVAQTNGAIDFRTEHTRYRHWKLDVEGETATLTMDVDEKGGLLGGYELKLNSYDLGVDIELADAIERLRFEHPEVKVVVLRSGKDRVFCAGANIRMLASATHAHKFNFCKFTN